MASVSVGQRNKGKGLPWRVTWRDRTGKQHQKTFPLKRDADAFAVKLEGELRSVTYTDPKQRRAPFQEAYALWRADRHVSPSRHAAEDSLATNHVLPRWGTTPIEDIKHTDIQRWVNELRTSTPHTVGKDDKGRDIIVNGYAWETVAACRQIVRHVLADAVRRKRLPTNEAADVNVPNKPRRDITSTDVLTPDEVARLVDAAPDNWSAFLLCTAWLGWRLNEGTSVRIADLNLPLGVLTLRGSKNRSATRMLPLPQSIVDALEKHLRDHVTDHRPNALVFPTAWGTVPDRSNMRRMLQKALKDAGLADRGIDFRQLRHTAASLMLLAGVHPYDVSYRLGHSRPSTTSDVYTHLIPRVTQDGTKALERLMRSGSDNSSKEGSTS